jgi:hypothetical protein
MTRKYIETQVRTGRTIQLSLKRSGGPWNFGDGIAYATRLLRLRWQWRVTYQLNQHGEWETYVTEPFQSRMHARQFKRLVPLIARNVKIQRRLMEVDWHDYSDTYTWNSGCGKR